MNTAAAYAGIHAEVGHTLTALRRSGFQRLSFPGALESRFEADTRRARAHRLWLEGLISILVFNTCLLLDFLLVGDASWQTLVVRTAVITPLAMAVNLLMLANPPRWLREGSVATVMVAIGFINLFVQGTATPTHALFGAICLFITALFAGVVMRLRFPYTCAAIVNMLFAGVWFLTQANGLAMSEVVVATSLLILALGIIIVAAYSLERQERLSYLLCLKSDLQTEAIAEANAELQRISELDKLTGLPNRRALEDRFQVLWAQCATASHALAVVVVDIDHFKAINDVYGHIYGDAALRRIAELLPKALRGSDDMAARFGGEEFVLLLPQATHEVAMTVAERVRTLVETAGTPQVSHATTEQAMWATVSCGVSVCVPAEGLTPTHLLDAADRALYTAKRGGRNCVKFNACTTEPQAPLEVVPERERLSPYLIHSGRPAATRTESGIRAVLGISS